MITAIAPSPSVDITYVVPQLRLGHISRPSEVHRVAGGKGLNVARAAQVLGADVMAVTVLGADSGAWIAAELARLGLPLRAVDVSGPTRSCISIADDGRHTMTEVYEPSAPVTSEEWASLLTAATDTVSRRPGWVTVSGSLPPGPDASALSDLVALAHASGRRIAVDVHGAPLLAALAAGADVVKVNVVEAADALGLDPATPATELAAELAGRTVTGAVVTAGVEGTWAVTHDGVRRHVGSSVHGQYPVGSGDCLLAGLVVGLDEGRDLLDSLVTATAVAVANALRPGAAVFAQQDVDEVRAGLQIS